MNFQDAQKYAQSGQAIFRNDSHVKFPFDMLVLVSGRTVKPSFGVMIENLGGEMDLKILDHFDGVNFTSRTSCELTVNVQLTAEDLLADDWLAQHGQSLLDEIFPDPASMTQ
jgi:hypothetical protein